MDYMSSAIQVIGGWGTVTGQFDSGLGTIIVHNNRELERYGVRTNDHGDGR